MQKLLVHASVHPSQHPPLPNLLYAVIFWIEGFTFQK